MSFTASIAALAAELTRQGLLRELGAVETDHEMRAELAAATAELGGARQRIAELECTVAELEDARRELGARLGRIIVTQAAAKPEPRKAPRKAPREAAK